MWAAAHGQIAVVEFLLQSVRATCSSSIYLFFVFFVLPVILQVYIML